MSRNFIAVFIFCALSAAHPDEQAAHLPVLQDSGWNRNDSKPLDSLSPLKSQIELNEILRIEANGKESTKDNEETEDDVDRGMLRKQKDVVIDETHFAEKILQAYGNGDSMSLEGLQKLLEKLGLLEIIDDVKDVNNSTRLNLNDGDMNRKTEEGYINSKELLAKLSEVESKSVPQMAALQMEVHRSTPAAWQVWIYSTICITIITLCGIVGVVIMPAMDKAYYNLLIQFLVALAIGTLCGDALIHLIPHAMSGAHGHTHTHVAEHSHVHTQEVVHPGYGVDYSSDYDYGDEHEPKHEHGHSHGHGHSHEAEHEHGHGHSHEHGSDHDSNMWKGLVVVLGLIVFYFMEKGLEAISERRTSRQQGELHPDEVKNHAGKYSLHPNSFGDINTGTKDNPHNVQHRDHQLRPAVGEEIPIVAISNSVLKTTDAGSTQRRKENTDNADSHINQTGSHAVIIRDHETKHHGHSHGNILEAGDSIANVAWMVIMGDGLHNFTDGIAIGAAFAAGLPGGFSTAIAVFFHELPQELGDFAVLLKAGMSVKKAMFYNLLSGSTCYLGMVLGILLGELPSATGWIFAASAGSFIYIALVDMVPELGPKRPGESGSKWYTPLHAIGLLSGAGIMLIIALYEHDLYNIIQ